MVSFKRTGHVFATMAGAILLMVSAAADPAEMSPPRCEQATLGQLSCQSGVRCECTYVRSSAMTDRPGGFQWDCGIKRPPCDPPPATLDPWLGPYPSSIGIDRTTIYELPAPPPPDDQPPKHHRERTRN